MCHDQKYLCVHVKLSGIFDNKKAPLEVLFYVVLYYLAAGAAAFFSALAAFLAAFFSALAGFAASALAGAAGAGASAATAKLANASVTANNNAFIFTFLIEISKIYLVGT
jgi:hypothetical protein